MITHFVTHVGDVGTHEVTFFGHFARDVFDMRKYLKNLEKNDRTQYPEHCDRKGRHKEKYVHLQKVVHVDIILQLFLLQIQTDRIDAVALTCRCRAVFEDVSEVRAATRAGDLGAMHTMRSVTMCLDRARKCLIK